MIFKNLYVFRGPCGGGKTWLRRNLLPEDIPVIDMENGPRAGSYKDRLDWLKRQLATHENHTALEGIFAPGTPSWRDIQTLAPSYGFTLISITITPPKEACLARVRDDADRTRFVEQYYDKFV